jgi:hypothetical protein
LNTPTITVTPYLAALPGDKSGGPRKRYRWRAEVTAFGGHPPHAVESQVGPDEAIGALVRALADRCETADDVLDLVASLFGDLAYRPADLQLGRAIRLAARHPHRRHPGCRVVLHDLVETQPQKPLLLRPALLAEGGAA